LNIRLEEENDPEHYSYKLNMEYSIDYWLEEGADPSKLLMGLALYGRGFQLEDAAQNGFYAPAV